MGPIRALFKTMCRRRSELFLLVASIEARSQRLFYEERTWFHQAFYVRFWATGRIGREKEAMERRSNDLKARQKRLHKEYMRCRRAVLTLRLVPWLAPHFVSKLRK